MNKAQFKSVVLGLSLLASQFGWSVTLPVTLDDFDGSSLYFNAGASTQGDAVTAASSSGSFNFVAGAGSNPTILTYQSLGAVDLRTAGLQISFHNFNDPYGSDQLFRVMVNGTFSDQGGVGNSGYFPLVQAQASPQTFNLSNYYSNIGHLNNVNDFSLYIQNDGTDISLAIDSIVLTPEPGTMIAVGTGLLALARKRRRKSLKQLSS